MSILVSGFEAFGGGTVNPTQLLMLTLPHLQSFETSSGAVIHEPMSLDEGSANTLFREAGIAYRATVIPASAEVRSAVLPVTFEGSFEVLAHEIENFSPDIVLSFGLAQGRDAIEIERVALNLVDAPIPDNAGAQPRNQPIEKRGPRTIGTTLPVDALVSALNAASVPARASDNAGRYVCNYLFYRVQDALRDVPEVKSGFIHVPALPSQAPSKAATSGAGGVEGSTASLAFETLQRGLEVILKTLVSN